MEVTKSSPICYWLYSFGDWFGVLGILYGAIALFGSERADYREEA